MCAFQLSPAQQQAVENRGGTLLVSAAAGSGKTRVLVERLFRYVMEEKADVDDFLIITFTRAAAAELRGRIVEELNKRLALTPQDGHLRRQLMRVYRADIKTIDSFCAGILRENIHLLEEDRQGNRLTADFRTLDENEAALLRQRTLQKVMEQYYEKRLDGGDTLLADTFGYGRSDEDLKKLIEEIYDKIQSHAYPMKWLQETRIFWESIPDDPAENPYGRELLDQYAQKAAYCAKRLRHAVTEFQDIDDIMKAYGDHFLSVAAQFDTFAQLAQQGNWSAAAEAMVVFPPRLGAVRNKDVEAEKNAAKAVWDQSKDIAKELAAFFAVSAEEYIEDMRAMAPAMLDLLTLTEEFALCYREEKTRRNLADFSDQAHDTIQLLVEEDGTPTALGEAVSARYLEIMVDEYQDTNEVQNRIFAAVSKQQKNLFLVGDVKQSIYRFRLADPGIFLKKYKEYAHCEDAAEGEPRKLLLSKNYRSRAGVLDAVNFVFENILSTRMGEMEYGDEERLYAGNEGYTPQPRCQTEFHYIAMPWRQQGTRKLKRQCAEARFVAQRIAELLSEGYGVQGEDGLRPVRAEDIVILMRAPGSRIHDYRSALEERGIPCSTDGGGGSFFETMEIAVTFQLLQLLDNPRQDVPLISVLSSPLFGFTPDRLAAIRAVDRKSDFYDALTAAEGDDVQDFLQRLRDLRALAKDKSVSEILSILYDEWNLPGVFGAMEGGVARRENLFTLLEHARRFESAGYRGLFAFTSQLRQQLEQGKAPISAAKSGSGGVRIMSIHKSKGLEFPVVFLTDLSHAFSTQDFREMVLVHPQLGLGPLCIDLNRRIKFPTLPRLAIEARLKREMKAEEMRILYVAMTRAREKLIMVGSVSGGEKRLGSLLATSSLPVDPEVVGDGKNLGDWVMMPLLQRPEAGALREAAGGNAIAIGAALSDPWQVRVHDGLHFGAVAAEDEEEATESLPEPDFSLELLDFVYPYENETTLPTVVSATQLKHMEEEETTLPPHYRGAKRPRFLDGTQKLSGAEAGTATHILMQHIDFHCSATELAVRKEIARVLRDRRITPAQAEAIRVKEVELLLASSMGERLRGAKELHREYRLSLLLDAKELDKNAAAGEQIMLHGVVDCWWENEDGTVTVVDFKTDRVRGEALEIRAEEYRPQVESYCRALERILEKRVSEKLLYFFSEGRTVAL